MEGIRFEGYDRVWYVMAPSPPVARARCGSNAHDIFAADDLETSICTIGYPDESLAKECLRVYEDAFNEGERYGRLKATQGIQGAILNAIGLSSVHDRLRTLEQAQAPQEAVS